MNTDDALRNEVSQERVLKTRVTAVSYDRLHQLSAASSLRKGIAANPTLGNMPRSCTGSFPRDACSAGSRLIWDVRKRCFIEKETVCPNR